MRRVVAIDPTPMHVSVAVFNEDGTVHCHRVLGDKPGVEPSRRVEQKQCPTDAHTYMLAVADRVAGLVANPRPELVVLRRPDPGTRKDDPHADKRIGLYWALVGALAERDIAVAELGTISAGVALCGNARGGHAELVAKVETLYPNLKLPEGQDGEPDKRYRVSTVALALLGAVAIRIPTPIEPTEHVWDALRKGGAFPPSVRLPKPAVIRPRNRNRSADEVSKATARAEAWGIEQRAEIRAMRSEAFWRTERPKSRHLQAAYNARVDTEIEALSELSRADLEGMPRPEDDDLRVAVDRRMAELSGEM